MITNVMCGMFIFSLKTGSLVRITIIRLFHGATPKVLRKCYGSL